MITTGQGGKQRIYRYLMLVVGYLLVVQMLPRLTASTAPGYVTYRSINDIFQHPVVAGAAGLLIGASAVTYLRWWRPVMRESHRTPRWTWVFPAVLVVAIAAGTSYPNLANKGLAFTLSLLLAAMLIGASEEIMFRGIGIVTFRGAGLSEGWVALCSCAIFGLAHATNMFVEGAGALLQVLVTTVAGYFFYLARRATGTLLVPIVIHSLWDFGLFSNNISTSMPLGVTIFVLTDLALAILAVVTVRRVFPGPSAAIS
jgi:uncharacterized protein